MSQTNTNTNNGENWNQISGRGGRGQGPGGRGQGDCRNNCRNNLIANTYLFEGNMKENPISKLVISKTRHQYKKFINTLPVLLVLCTDKNYRCIDDIILTRTNLVEADFTLPYPDAG